VNRILAVGYLANILPGAGVSISLGKGRPDVQMKAGIIAMTSNILLTILLIFPSDCTVSHSGRPSRCSSRADGFFPQCGPW